MRKVKNHTIIIINASIKILEHVLFNIASVIKSF